jgi:hypothetical protein
MSQAINQVVVHLALQADRGDKEDAETIEAPQQPFGRACPAIPPPFDLDLALLNRSSETTDEVRDRFPGFDSLFSSSLTSGKHTVLRYPLILTFVFQVSPDFLLVSVSRSAV